MCSHSWVTVNDVKVCTRCGLTRTFDGKYMFDKNLPNYKRGKGNEKRNSNKKRN